MGQSILYLNHMSRTKKVWYMVNMVTVIIKRKNNYYFCSKASKAFSISVWSSVSTMQPSMCAC